MMKFKNLPRFSVLIIIVILLPSCPQDSPELPGVIKGIVTDAETSEPIFKAKINVGTSDKDTTSTLIDGTYSLGNIEPGKYEIQASKLGYLSKKENNIVVNSASEEEVNFSLNKIPTLNVSPVKLDFGLDSNSLKFNISKIGTGTLTYSISSSQSWITFSPTGGEVTGETETDIITVTVNRTDLVKGIYKETVKVSQMIGSEVIQEVPIEVYLNGIWIDSKYVYIVRIGTQVWMGANLNVGARIDGSKGQTDNGITEKYCYNDFEFNCDEYGGLYQWDEMMQYNPAEDSFKIIGTTQGICPDGWHLPTWKEWFTLLVNLGGWNEAGGKMKATGTIHWTAPNTGATNESGFTGLPGGFRGLGDPLWWGIGLTGEWWSTCLDWSMHTENFRIAWYLVNNNARFEFRPELLTLGYSVRCVRNP